MKTHLMVNLSEMIIFDCASPIEPFRCPQCAGFKTHDLIELKRHFRADHALIKPEEEKPYDCESCSFRTFSTYLHLRHNLYDLCMKNRKVKSEETLEIKESGIGDDKETAKIGSTSFQCSYCSSELCSRFSLEQHVKIVHGSCERRRKTIACGPTHYTENSRDYKSPVLAKRKKYRKTLKCDHCSYQTKYRTTLKDHVTTRHMDPEKIQWFSCEHCSYRGKTKTYLRVHLSVHHQIREPVKCEHCPFETKLKRCLKTHILLKHTEVDKIRWHQCPYCPHRTRASSNLCRHVSYKHGNREILRCEHCPFVTKFKYSMRTHINSKHTEGDMVQWFQCAHCPYKSKRDTNLSSHVKYNHSKRELVKCDHCSFQTKYKSNLKSHIMRQHTKPKKVSCEHCAYRCKSEVRLKKHIFDRHSEGENLECDLCPFVTRHTRSLTRHVRTLHTHPEEVKWFYCEHCSYKSRKEALVHKHAVRHLPTNSGDEQASCNSLTIQI